MEITKEIAQKVKDTVASGIIDGLGRPALMLTVTPFTPVAALSMLLTVAPSLVTTVRIRY